jgi:hypothetical protein
MYKKPSSEPGLEKAIENVLSEMEGHSPYSKEYADMVAQVVKLYEVKAKLAKPRISYDTWANIVANLAGIALILNHERANIVTSKAVSFVQKLH